MTQQGINDELYSNALSKFSPQQAPNFGFTSYVRNYAVGDINIANGSVCYIDLTNTAYRAMADSAAHCSGILGIAQGPNPGVGQPMSFLALGYWNNSYGFIPGQPVYLSDVVWGGLQQNAPSNPLSVVRSVGYTPSYGILSFNLGGLGVMPGPTGANGPNVVNTSTTTTLTGILKGSGGNIAIAIDGTDYMTPSDVAASYVPNTTTVTGVSGLSGGGALSSNQTLSLDLTNIQTWTGKQTFNGMAFALLASTLLKVNSGGTVVSAVAGTDYQAPLNYQKGSDAVTVSAGSRTNRTITFSPSFGSTPTVVITLNTSITPLTGGNAYLYNCCCHKYAETNTGFSYSVCTFFWYGQLAYGFTGSVDWIAWL